MKAILDQTRDLPMGVCLDTAHTFEAGYDITTEEGLEATLDDGRSHRGSQSRVRAARKRFEDAARFAR